MTKYVHVYYICINSLGNFMFYKRPVRKLKTSVNLRFTN